MTREFVFFDSEMTREGRFWRWSILSDPGNIVLQGSERNRRAAQYQAARAMFLLLSTAPYRSQIPGGGRGQTFSVLERRSRIS